MANGLKHEDEENHSDHNHTQSEGSDPEDNYEYTCETSHEALSNSNLRQSPSPPEVLAASPAPEWLDSRDALVFVILFSTLVLGHMCTRGETEFTVYVRT